MIEMYRIIVLMLALISASILAIKLIIEKVILKFNLTLKFKISIIVTALFLGGFSLFHFSNFWGFLGTLLGFLGVAYFVEEKYKNQVINYRRSLLYRIKP
jgi:hypothetical protein